MIFFEPNVLEFLRPTDIYLIGELFVPVVLWSTMNVVLTVSQYISTIMQGLDRVGMESEIRLSTYWNSLVFFANIAEFISTVSYVALIVSMIFLAKFIHIQLYVIDGVIISSWISIILAIIIRAKKYPEIKEYIPVKSLLKEYAAPLLVASAVLYVLKYPLMIVFAPTVSAIMGLARLAVLLVITTLVYAVSSAAISGRVRPLIRTVLARYLKWFKMSSGA